MLPIIIVKSPIAWKRHSHVRYMCGSGSEGRHCAGCLGTAVSTEDKLGASVTAWWGWAANMK